MLFENFDLNKFDISNYIFQSYDKKENYDYPMFFSNKHNIKIDYIDDLLIQEIFNFKKTPIAFIIVLDNVILLYRIRDNYFSTEKHLINYLIDNNSYLFQAIYMGSSTRQGKHSCAYDNEKGYMKRTLQIYIYDGLDTIIENTFLDLTKTSAKLILQTEIDFNSYNILEFNELLFQFNDFTLTFNFRQLYKFNNDIEISSIKLSKIL